MTMLTEHVPTLTGVPAGTMERLEADAPAPNPIDPRLPPEAPMLMPAQTLHPQRDGLMGWLRAMFPPFGQAG